MGKPSDRTAVDVVFASHSSELKYGGERSLLDHILYLKSCGIVVHVILPREGSFSARLIEENISFSTIFMPRWVRGPGIAAPFRLRRADPRSNTLAQLVTILNATNPKLCVTNTIAIPWLAYAAALTGTRHAWIVREFGDRFEYTIGLKAARRSISVLSDAVFFNSHATELEYSQDIQAAKVRGVLYPGADTSARPEAIQSPFNPESLHLVILGRVEEAKGQLEAIQALEIVRQAGIAADLVILGGIEEANYGRKVAEAIRSAGLEDCVKLLGFVHNASSYLSLADICVVCSRDEAFGRATVEAMYMGLPVIGAKDGGTAEIIVDGENGLLYEPGNFADLARKIMLLHERPDLREELAKTARITALERYSQHARYAEFMTYYSNLGTLPNSGLDLRPMLSIIEDYHLLRSPSALIAHYSRTTIDRIAGRLRAKFR